MGVWAGVRDRQTDKQTERQTDREWHNVSSNTNSYAYGTAVNAGPAKRAVGTRTCTCLDVYCIVLCSTILTLC